MAPKTANPGATAKLPVKLCTSIGHLERIARSLERQAADLAPPPPAAAAAAADVADAAAAAPSDAPLPLLPAAVQLCATIISAWWCVQITLSQNRVGADAASWSRRDAVRELVVAAEAITGDGGDGGGGGGMTEAFLDALFARPTPEFCGKELELCRRVFFGAAAGGEDPARMPAGGEAAAGIGAEPVRRAGVVRRALRELAAAARVFQGGGRDARRAGRGARGGRRDRHQGGAGAPDARRGRRRAGERRRGGGAGRGG